MLPGKTERLDVASDTKLTIEGVVELLGILRKMQDQLPKNLKKASNQVAKDWISAAKNKANGEYAGRAAQALSVGSTEDGSTITNSYPGFYGEEFGGRSRPETMMFPPHNGTRGYFLFPAGRENADKFQQVWEAAIDDVAKVWKN